jgi:hypothetical protein
VAGEAAAAVSSEFQPATEVSDLPAESYYSCLKKISSLLEYFSWILLRAMI